MKKEYDIVTTVELEGGVAKMCNLSDYVWEKAMEQEKQNGLSALVCTLSTLLADAEEIYQAVIKNEVYKDISREKIIELLNGKV